jgi:hypothetical protein
VCHPHKVRGPCIPLYSRSRRGEKRTGTGGAGVSLSESISQERCSSPAGARMAPAQLPHVRVHHGRLSAREATIMKDDTYTDRREPSPLRGRTAALHPDWHAPLMRGNRAQILIDRAEITARHPAIDWPGHDLQDGGIARRQQVILQVNSRSHPLEELLPRQSGRLAILAGGDIAGDERAKRHAAAR